MHTTIKSLKFLKLISIVAKNANSNWFRLNEWEKWNGISDKRSTSLTFIEKHVNKTNTVFMPI